MPKFSVACYAMLIVLPTVGSAHDGTCKNTAPSEATLTSRQALQQDPKKLDARLKLADALIADSCFDDAVRVLEEGETINGRNAELQSHLREARSMLTEQRYFEGLDRAGAAAKLSRNLLRCNKLADLAACDEALAQKPDDVDATVAKANALLQLKRPAEALVMYRRAKELEPGNAALDDKIATAVAQRQALVNACQNSSGDAALQACQSAIMRGGDDEFVLLKRKGFLLQTANQLSPALDAYIAAHLLKRGDRSVALAIVVLSENTDRKDALALAARGSALIELGRATEARAPLKQALALGSDLPEVKAQLERAELLAKQEARRQQVAAATPGVSPQVLAAAVAAAPARRYSNEAPVTRSN